MAQCTLSSFMSQVIRQASVVPLSSSSSSLSSTSALLAADALSAPGSNKAGPTLHHHDRYAWASLVWLRLARVRQKLAHWSAFPAAAADGQLGRNGAR